MIRNISWAKHFPLAACIQYHPNDNFTLYEHLGQADQQGNATVAEKRNLTPKHFCIVFHFSPHTAAFSSHH